jgi:hypothetical protein
MDITIHVTLRHSSGPDATTAEIQAQLVEEIASISTITVEHSTTSGTRWADYTIETVQLAEDES